MTMVAALCLLVHLGPTVALLPPTLEQAVARLGAVANLVIELRDERDEEARAVRRWVAWPRRGQFWEDYARLEQTYGLSLEWVGQNQFDVAAGPAVVRVVPREARTPTVRAQGRYRVVLRPNRSGEAEVRLEFVPGAQRVIAARWRPPPGAPGVPSAALVHWGAVALGAIPEGMGDLLAGQVEVTTARRSTTVNLELLPGSAVTFSAEHPVRRAVVKSFARDGAATARRPGAPRGDRYALALDLEGPFCEQSACWLWDCRIIDGLNRALAATILETSLPAGRGAQSFRIVVPVPEFEAPPVRFQAELPSDLEVQTLELAQMRLIRGDGA